MKEAAEAADAEADAIHSMQVGAAIQCDNDSSVCGDVGIAPTCGSRMPRATASVSPPATTASRALVMRLQGEDVATGVTVSAAARLH